MEVNWISIVIAAVSTFALGFIWYNPKTFGQAWMESVGMKEEDAAKGNMPLIFGISFVLSLVVAYYLATRAGRHQSPEDHTFIHGIVHGFFAVAYTALPVLITNSLYEQRSWKGILINVGYWIVNFCLIGGIVFALKGAGF